ncbi:hypothetical protein [Streptomyces sp. NPDC051364]|uniref:hypothetical protein n=1 Tax=Streptomyces sp. NPDC051364 TaxID=3155799 RepID=UPI0034413496
MNDYDGHTYTGSSTIELAKPLTEEQLAKLEHPKTGDMLHVFATALLLGKCYDLTCRFSSSNGDWVETTLTPRAPSWLPDALRERLSGRPAHTSRTGWSIETRTALVKVTFHAEKGPAVKGLPELCRDRKGHVTEDSFGRTLHESVSFIPRQTFELDAVDCESGSLLPTRLRHDQSNTSYRHVIELSRTS